MDVLASNRVYVKPTFGSKGEGIFVIEKEDDNTYQLIDNQGNCTTYSSYKHLLEALQNKIDSEERYFVQEEAKTVLYENAPFDIRVLVQNYGSNYKVTGKAVRIGQKFSITSNLNSGGTAIPFEEMEAFFYDHYNVSLNDLGDQIEKLCLDCVGVLKSEFEEFCEIGFDILVTKDKGPIIIEGNAKPSRWVFVKMADYLKDKGKDNSHYLNCRRETVGVPMKYASYLRNQLMK